jgi:hypothetical protein
VPRPEAEEAARGRCRIMIEYSSILCLYSMDFLASNRQQQQKQQKQENLKAAGPAGEKFKFMISGTTSGLGRISGHWHPPELEPGTDSDIVCPDTSIRMVPISGPMIVPTRTRISVYPDIMPDIRDPT